MTIQINGELQERDAGETLEDVVAKWLGPRDPRGIAVALNDEIVPRGRWRDTRLPPESRIEILQAVAGG